MNKDLLYADGLAAELGKSRGYVYAMKKEGFEMPGHSATLVDARAWLQEYKQRTGKEFACTKYANSKSAGQPNKKAPKEDVEKFVKFHWGEDLQKQPDLGLLHQAMFDGRTGQGQGQGRDLLPEEVKAMHDEDAFEIGKIVFEKLVSHDVHFFEALAKLVRFELEESASNDPIRCEIVLLKFEAQRNGERDTVQTLRLKLEKSVSTGRLESFSWENSYLKKVAQAFDYPLVE